MAAVQPQPALLFRVHHEADYLGKRITQRAQHSVFHRLMKRAFQAVGLGHGIVHCCAEVTVYRAGSIAQLAVELIDFV